MWAGGVHAFMNCNLRLSWSEEVKPVLFEREEWWDVDGCGPCVSANLFGPGKRLWWLWIMWDAGINRAAVTVPCRRSNAGSYVWHAPRSGPHRCSSAVLEVAESVLFQTHAFSSKLYSSQYTGVCESSTPYNPQFEGHRVWMVVKKTNIMQFVYVLCIA